jgi:hypothetical protein
MATPLNIAKQRCKMIRLLEEASMLADDLKDNRTGDLIKRALEEAVFQGLTPLPRTPPGSISALYPWHVQE